VVRLAPRRLPFAAMCIPEAANGITLPIARFAAWGRAIGVPVHVWTVNTAADAHRLWDAGVTGVISDDPEAILAARAARATR
jgi:glycerophosphoryl diester phosphodiesterase